MGGQKGCNQQKKGQYHRGRLGLGLSNAARSCSPTASRSWRLPRIPTHPNQCPPTHPFPCPRQRLARRAPLVCGDAAKETHGSCAFALATRQPHTHAHTFAHSNKRDLRALPPPPPPQPSILAARSSPTPLPYTHRDEDHDVAGQEQPPGRPRDPGWPARQRGRHQRRLPALPARPWPSHDGHGRPRAGQQQKRWGQQQQQQGRQRPGQCIETVAWPAVAFPARWV